MATAHECVYLLIVWKKINSRRFSNVRYCLQAPTLTSFHYRVHFFACYILFQTSPTMSYQIPTSYDCTFCNRHFTSSSGLARHLKSIHPTPSLLPKDGTKYVRFRHNFLSGESRFLYHVRVPFNKLISNFCQLNHVRRMAHSFVALSQSQFWQNH